MARSLTAASGKRQAGKAGLEREGRDGALAVELIGTLPADRGIPTGESIARRCKRKTSMGHSRLTGKTGPGWPALDMGVLLIAAAVLIALAACETPQPRKRTFVGQGASVRKNVSEPTGLNPLGTLNTCGNSGAPPETGRVLVSRPEFFTEDASRMIIALREALAGHADSQELLELQLSAAPIASQQEAVGEGQRCGALIVLWEQRKSQTLEITLPNPAKVPLRSQVKGNLCEFGNHSEQVTILYYTIIGLTAMVNHDYAQAKYYLDAANRIDVDCLRIPLADQSNSPPSKP